MNVGRTDRAYLVRESPSDGPQVARESGSFVFDERGRKYIDFVSGWCVGNLGWGNEQIRRAVRRFNGPDYVAPFHLYAPWVELAKLLAEATPGDLKHCVRATGGTEAVEIALQVAMLHTGRRGFVSVEGSYHGNSIGTMSVASSEFRERYGNLLPHCRKVKPPLDAKAADRVEGLLRRKDVAAFIMEPVICNLGVLVPEPAFVAEVRRLCRRYGTLFIADEVATGFGRTGKLFACEHFGVDPDLMCLAKAITGGYAGLGATVMTEEVARSIDGEFGAWSTYGWHPLAVEAAVANVRYFLGHRDRLLSHVNKLADYFGGRLAGMKFRHPTEIRVKGLAIGIKFEAEDYASEIETRCRKEGLLVNADDDALLLFPALNLERKTAEQGLDVLEACL